MLKNKYSSGDLLGGLVLGQQSQRRQNISNHTKQMLQALLGGARGGMQRDLISYDEFLGTAGSKRFNGSPRQQELRAGGSGHSGQV